MDNGLKNIIERHYMTINTPNTVKWMMINLSGLRAKDSNVFTVLIRKDTYGQEAESGEIPVSRLVVYKGNSLGGQVFGGHPTLGRIVFPVFGSEPMPNLNGTRTGPHVLFGVRQILDFVEPDEGLTSKHKKDNEGRGT
ncbi:hypothetical protein B0H14DRAFT_2605365 [Mycena olivaceomarginata]|nr:hypothetical protein B0H14DRAFT_2605365 [Mycena olivaceomarginata]